MNLKTISCQAFFACLNLFLLLNTTAGIVNAQSDKCPEEIQIFVSKYPSNSKDKTGKILIIVDGSKLEYSIDNGLSYQLSPQFDSLYGNYNYKISVRSCTSLCTNKLEYFLEVPKRTSSLSFDVQPADCNNSFSGKLSLNVDSNPRRKVKSPKINRKFISGSIYEYSIDGGKTWSFQKNYNLNGGYYTVLARNPTRDDILGDIILVDCYSCFDGKKNGFEIEVDCGGKDCHSCQCPSIDEVKLSANLKESYTSIKGKKIRLHQFICDHPDYRDCRICISYRSCHDDIDNDKTIVLDCEDPKCLTWFDTLCTRRNTQCMDGLDNDHDGLLDCLDPNCNNSIFCGFVNQKGGRYSESFNHRELSMLLLRASEGTDFIKEVGIPFWDKSFRRGIYVVTPISYFNEMNISGIIISRIENGHPSSYNIHFLPELVRAVQSEDKFRKSYDRYFMGNSLYTTLLLFCIADQKFNGGQNVLFINYLIENNWRADVNRKSTNDIFDHYCLLVCDSFYDQGEDAEIMRSRSVEGFPGSCPECVDFKIDNPPTNSSCFNWSWICSAPFDAAYAATTNLILKTN